jgi:hypothetical protein
MPTAQDALRDHFRAGYTVRPYVETVNANPKASDRPESGFVSMEFLGGSEEMVSFGSPGNNRYRRQGFCRAHVYLPAGTSPLDAESAAVDVAAVFRAARIPIDGTRTIRIYGVDPAQFGPAEGRFFRATIDFEYWYDTYS